MPRYQYTTPLSRRSCVVHAAAILLPAVCLAGQPTISFQKVVWEDIDPFPGRPGETYRTIDSEGFDAEGNLSLRGQTQGITGPALFDLLVFDQASGEVHPVQQGGFTAHPDLPDNFLLDVPQAIRNQSGSVASHWQLFPQAPGLPTRAFFLTKEDIQTNLAAHNAQSVPGQPPGTIFTALGFVQTLVMRFNDAGTLAIRGSFQVDSTDFLGLYRIDDGQTLTLIYDSSLPVPGHPNASWIPFQATATQWPFDKINTMQVSDLGDVFWQGLITEDGVVAHPALFRQAPDGGVSHILGGPKGEVPGRPPGIIFLKFTGFLANGNGTVAMAGQANPTLDMGIYAARVGQPFSKTHDNTDPIPGIPQADGFSLHTLSALNDRGDIVFGGNFNGPPQWPNGGGGTAILLQPADGPKELVMRYDRLPGQPPGAWAQINSSGNTRLNNRGDVIILVNQIMNGTPNKMAYMYLRDRRELVSVLVPGTMIDGMMLFNWDYVGFTGYGGGKVEFRDDRSFVARLLLAGPDQIPLTADDIRGLYIVRVEADL